MPLVDLSMVEQRYDAVREVLDGATVTPVATGYGVDRRTLETYAAEEPSMIRSSYTCHRAPVIRREG